MNAVLLARRDWGRVWPHPAVGFATVAAVTVIYAVTISPFAQAGDASELIMDAQRLVAAHPPGYPVYTVLAHLFTLLPVSTLAWRVGLFSLCCQVAAAAFLFVLVRDWLGRSWIASVVTLFFSLAPLTWRYAIEPEVFALNNLFAVVLLLLFQRYRTRPRLSLAYGACALLGLAACNHLTIVLFALPFFAALLWHDRRRLLRPKILAIGIALFAAGLLPYLLLFYLGRQRLLISWGDFSTWNGFFTHIFRSEYGVFKFSSSTDANANFFAGLYYFGWEMCVETLFLPIVFWVWGLARLGGKNPEAAFARLLALGLGVYVIVFLLLSNVDLGIPIRYHDEARMWILPLLLLLLLAGWGIGDVERRLTGKYKTACLAAVLVGTVALGVAWNWRVQDESRRDFFERVAHSMIDAVEPNAVMLIRGDTYVNGLLYLQTVKGVRPDVHVIRLGLLPAPWMRRLVEANVPGFRVPDGPVISLDRLLDLNVDRFPIYLTALAQEDELISPGRFTRFPVGFQERVKRAGAEFTPLEVRHEIAPFLDLKMPDPNSYRRASWENYIRDHRYRITIAMARLLVQGAQGRPDWLMVVIDVLAKEIESNSPPGIAARRP